MGGASLQEGDYGRKQRELRFDGFMGAVLFFTQYKKAKRDLVILVVFFSNLER